MFLLILLAIIELVCLLRVVLRTWRPDLIRDSSEREMPSGLSASIKIYNADISANPDLEQDDV